MQSAPDSRTGGAPDAAPPLIDGTLPPSAPAPVPTRRVYFLFAPLVALAALVLPKRFGPRLTASSFLAAYVANWFGWALLYLIAFHVSTSIGLARAGTLYQPLQLADLWLGFTQQNLSAGDFIAVPAAHAVLFLMASSQDVDTLIQGATVVGAAQLGPWLAAMPLMPWIASGERRRTLYLRSVKLLLWSSVTLWILPFLMLPASILGYYASMPTGVAFMIWGGALIIYLQRWGLRYAGPPLGPAYEERPLRCEQCAYQLAMLPVDGRCPECGRAVRDSLPEHRRPPAFARARWRGRLRAYFVTLWRSLWPRRFARHLCVQHGHGHARAFALLSCMTVGLVALGLLPLVLPNWWLEGLASAQVSQSRYGMRPQVEAELWFRVAQAVVVLNTWGVATLTAAGAVVLVGALVTLGGWAQPARRGLIVAYGSGFLVLPAGLLVAAAWWGHYVAVHWQPRGAVTLWMLGKTDWETLWLVIGWGPFGIALLLWLLHIRALLRATRYTNA